MWSPSNPIRPADDEETWGRYIAGTVAAAVLAAFGTRLAEWCIDEIRSAVGRAPPRPPTP